MINLREAMAIHAASLPRHWPDVLVDENMCVWLRGFIAACVVLGEHQSLQTLAPGELEKLARNALELVDEERLARVGRQRRRAKRDRVTPP